MHGEVLSKANKVIGTCDKIGFAIYLNEYPDLSIAMDVGMNSPLVGRTP